MSNKFVLFSFILIACLGYCDAATRDEVLNYLRSIRGSRTISGQHNAQHNGQSGPAYYTNRVTQMTGKTPGLWGGDFSCWQNDVQRRGEMINEAINQWKAGSMVTLTFNVCPPKPNVGEWCAFDDKYNGVMATLTNEEWDSLLINGREMNLRWKERIENAYVPHLRRLVNEGIVPILRPFQELNGGWFWWSSTENPERTKELYRLTYREFQRHLPNQLIFNWCVSEAAWDANRPFSKFYAGPDFVDILSLDVYANATDNVDRPGNYQAKYGDYQELLNLAGGSGGKLIALGELGQCPTPETLRNQTNWIYFMIWGEYLENENWNTESELRRTYNDMRVSSRGQVRKF